MTGADRRTDDRSPGSGARITVEDLSVSFGEIDVLSDVSLSIDPGEFVGLVGPNGAGKTTLLRSLSGAVSPTAGTVTIDGSPIHDRTSQESSQLVAVVPQETALSFSFDVRTVVEMGRYPHRGRFSPPTDTDRHCVDRALERTRTAQFADRPIDELSGGERQRVVLARAIAQDTPVLLLDEPTASLDINHQIETLELVDGLVEDGHTVVAAIHDLTLAARYCDRLIVLADQTVHQTGPPEAVLTSAALRTGFDANAAVVSNPITGTPAVTALPDDDTDGLPDNIHVVGTGSGAVGVLARLDAAGIEASLGPVVRGTVAAETADRLGVDSLAIDPFAPLSEDRLDELDRALAGCQVVICAGLEANQWSQPVHDRLREHECVVCVDHRAGGTQHGDHPTYTAVTTPDRLLETIASLMRSPANPNTSHRVG